MAVQTTKEKVLKAIRELPDEMTIEDAMELFTSFIKLRKDCNRQIPAKRFLIKRQKNDFGNG